MILAGDILSVRMRNRAVLIRAWVHGEAGQSCGLRDAELLRIAADLDRDAERVMTLEVKQGHSA